jgi:hypothetical protein
MQREQKRHERAAPPRAGSAMQKREQRQRRQRMDQYVG